MADNKSFELPRPTDKLSLRFILEAVDKKKEDEPVESDPLQLDLETYELEMTEDLPQQEEAPTVAMTPLNLPPTKKYFRIGEVSALLDIESYVLRYWEQEFPVIRPSKSRSGQRVYARKDVETLHHIKHLLHHEKYSIKGAKQKLLAHRREVSKQTEIQKKSREILREMATEVRRLIKLIEK